uniref:Uncharacterized protein n=1 Tax=Cyanothece sp. (strain PCC 7425 / ATCC 29141) TaxID=395961 RepID=B8HNJ1_CYAP4
MKRLWRWLSFMLIVLSVAASTILSSGELPFLLPTTVRAQTLIGPKQAAEQFYRQVPNFPKENQYLSLKTNQPSENNTLIERLVVYHTLVKGRSPLYRLDWKVTLADFLGLNEYLDASTYPGRLYLKTNPMEADRAVIVQLNRQQRDVLVQTLVNIYSAGKAAQTPPVQSPPAQTTPAAVPSPVPNPTLQPLAKPGDAQLLAPPAPANGPQPRPAPTGDARLLLP